MLAQLIVFVIMVALNSSLLDRSIHAFDTVSRTGQALAIGRGMFDLGQPVINVVSGASTLKGMAPEQLSFCPHLPDVGRRPALASGVSELNAIVSENRVYLVWTAATRLSRNCFEMAVVAFG
jgi:hypothetical protein